MKYVLNKSTNSVNLYPFQVLITKTYSLVTLGFFMASVAAYVSLGHYFGFVGSLILFLLSFGLMFGAYKHQDTEWGLPLFLGFTSVMGFMLGPILNSYLMLPNGHSIIMRAIFTTALATTGLTYYAFKSGRSFNQLNGFLFVGLWIIIIGGVVNLFTKSTVFELVLASMSALIFSGYILYDTSRLLNGNVRTPLEGAISLFLNIFNLFTSLLRIFGGTNR